MPEMCSKVIYKLLYCAVNKVKDLTKRYATDWLTYNRKLRLDETWWTISLQPFAWTNREQEEREDLIIHGMIITFKVITTFKSSIYYNSELYSWVMNHYMNIIFLHKIIRN